MQTTNDGMTEIKFTFSASIAGKEIVTRTIEYKGDPTHIKFKVFSILKELEDTKTHSELERLIYGSEANSLCDGVGNH